MLQRLFRHGFTDTRPVPSGYSRLVVDADGNFGILRSDQTIDHIPTHDAGGADFLDEELVVGSATALVTATAKTITSIALTEGTWEIEGFVTLIGAASTTTVRRAGIHSADNTLPTDGTVQDLGFPTTTANHSATIHLMRKRVVVPAGGATYYLVASATFSAGTMTAHGKVQAKRLFI